MLNVSGMTHDRLQKLCVQMLLCLLIEIARASRETGQAMTQY